MAPTEPPGVREGWVTKGMDVGQISKNVFMPHLGSRGQITYHLQMGSPLWVTQMCCHPVANSSPTCVGRCKGIPKSSFIPCSVVGRK